MPNMAYRFPSSRDAADEALMELLEANVVDFPDYRVLALGGEIDASVADDLLARIIDLIDHGHTPLLIDMTDVKFCDSTGLTVAVTARRYAAAAGNRLAF